MRIIWIISLTYQPFLGSRALYVYEQTCSVLITNVVLYKRKVTHYVILSLFNIFNNNYLFSPILNCKIGEFNSSEYQISRKHGNKACG